MAHVSDAYFIIARIFELIINNGETVPSIYNILKAIFCSFSQHTYTDTDTKLVSFHRHRRRHCRCVYYIHAITWASLQ